MSTLNACVSALIVLIQAVVLMSPLPATEFPPAFLDDPFPPAPSADEVQVSLWPSNRLDVLGTEMVAICEVTNICTSSVWLDWQPRGYSTICNIWQRHDVDGIKFTVDEQIARWNGITIKDGPPFGGTQPIVTLLPAETRLTGIRIDEYLQFTQPIHEPVTLTWTLRLREGHTKTGQFTLRVTATQHGLAQRVEDIRQDSNNSEQRLELEPLWEPSR